MINLKSLNWQDFHTFAFDFDGVFTNNKVIVDEFGNESVVCDRSDGLALDMLKKFITLNKWDLKYFVISKETNKVVLKRCEKLGINCFFGVDNKKKFLKDYLNKRFGEYESSREGLIYLGNDLNDLSSMLFAGLSVAPNDAHTIIKGIANYVIDKKGGDSFVRNFIEEFLKIDKENLTSYNFFD